MKVITDERCAEYRQPGHPERPERILSTIQRLKTQAELPITWASPGTASETTLLRAHTSEHLARLEHAHDFDADTPFFPRISAHARTSVGAALTALQCAREGE